ncbi:hypothetical protein [uncultured Microbulbifer sp.]|uniref:hypothetical protein n=1 Tax=uncultured Microbulbifer sp. TaxID=348147 RepID=UPI002625F347|nr:hypothetical protein [uncultured Microbulbifer sp.]
MAVNRGCALVLTSVLGVFGWSGLVLGASSLTVEQNKLARMEQSQENRLVALEDVENEMLAYEYKLQRAEESLSKARANYEESLMAFKVAEREHKTAASSDTERALHKAKHAYAMAERGVDSRKRRVDIVQSTFGDLEARLQDARESVSSGETRLTGQQALVDKLVQAMLVKAEEQKQAAKSTASAPAVEAPAVAKPSLASLEPVEPTMPELAAPSADNEIAAPERDIDPELLEYVRGERDRLEKLLSELDEDEEGRQTFRNLSLRPSGEDSIEFEFLGQNQYRLVAPVSAGRQTYKINSWRFRRTIPSDDDGERYVFVFDARRLSRPRLVMYPEYVLSRLD